MTIIESGIHFGDYPEDMVFHIEESAQYVRSLRQNGIKSCEFILRKDDPSGKRRLYFIEAKSSCPNHWTGMSNDERREKYHQDIEDICRKMQHSLTLYGSVLLNRFSKDGISANMLEADLSQYEIYFVLVVKKAKKEWLIPYREVFSQQLRDIIRLWNVRQFIVLNEDMAIASGLAVREEV